MPESSASASRPVASAAALAASETDLAREKTRADGAELPFDIEPFRKECLVNGWDDIGLTLRHADAIREFCREQIAHYKVARYIRFVDDLPVTVTGKPQKFLKVYSFCTPSTAREMVDFSPHMAAYLPCRITGVEKEDGLWMYTLNMDMMVKMGRKLPSPLKENAWKVRDTIWEMMERGSKGEF